jgi:hypothetical protein
VTRAAVLAFVRRHRLPLIAAACLVVSLSADTCAAILRNQSQLGTALVDAGRLTLVELFLLGGGAGAAWLAHRHRWGGRAWLLVAGLACVPLALLSPWFSYLYLRVVLSLVDPAAIGWTSAVPPTPPGMHSVPAVYFSMDRAMAGIALWVAYHTYREGRARLRALREHEQDSVAAEMTRRRREMQSDHLSRSLEAIEREALVDPAAANRMLVRLGDELRAVIHGRGGAPHDGPDAGAGIRTPGTASPGG